MNVFEVNTQFDDLSSLLEAKKKYEIATKNILVIVDAHKLKGDGPLVTSTVYERINFECKAGKERQHQGKGIRSSSTYKMNCPFVVKLSLVNGKLTVKHLNPNHENHASDERTFQSYPENVRLNEEETAEAQKMLSCGASKQKLKAYLMKDREAPVTLKSLHNIQTAMQQEKKKPDSKSGLSDLIEMMLSIPNARVRIIGNEKQEFVGLFFQDQRMAQIFEKYPEIVFFDATNKLNNLDLALFIQLCIDGNGVSEIVNLYVCKSESRESIGAMIKAFKNLNPTWTKTRVIIGDKDFADRSIYEEEFPDAVLQICLFHVQLTFRREITTEKRSITNDQRDVVLEILQRLVYAKSEESYDAIYEELIKLNLEKVTKYYNDNWHNIRNQWTLYGCNRYSSYLNGTNNRLESLNSKVKLIGNRHANILTFFENVSISVSNLSSEKDVNAIRGTMKRHRMRLDDPVLPMYKDYLTPYIFEKIKEQYELADIVALSFIDNEKALTIPNNYTVSHNSCSCLFVSSLCLACRHIFKYLMEKGLDVFVPELCATRWTKAYYSKSHPALSQQMQITHPPLAYVKVRVPDEIDRYKKSAKLTKEINNVAAQLSTGQYTYFMDRLRQLKDEMLSPPRGHPGDNSCVEMAPLADPEAKLTPLMGREAEITPFIGPQVEIPLMGNDVEQDQIHTGENARLLDCENTLLPTFDVSNTNNQHDAPAATFNQSKPVDVLSSIQNIVMPRNVTAVGRPKGSVKTVIGTQRKVKKRNQVENIVCQDEPPQKKTFVDMNKEEQSVTIMEWLTNYDRKIIVKKKISSNDLIKDINVFNRLRNDEVFLGALKTFVDVKCFQFLKNEVCKLYGQPWKCSLCNLDLNLKGLQQVMCNICLDRFHYKCVGITKKTENGFVCSSC